MCKWKRESSKSEEIWRKITEGLVFLSCVGQWGVPQKSAKQGSLGGGESGVFCDRRVAAKIRQ